MIWMILGAISDMDQYVQRKHRVIDTPFIGPVLLFLYGDLVSMIVCGVASEIIPEPFYYYVGALGGVLMVFIHRQWFCREYRGGLYTESLKDQKFWKIFLILVAIDAVCCVYDMAACGFVGITAVGIAESVMAGICEEISDRYIVISTMMRRYKKTGNYVPVLLFTSMLFGLSHYINIDTAADFWPVTLQVIVTICSGIAMGAIFIRTGNILVSIVWHTFHDLLCTMSAEVSTTNTIFLGVSWSDLIECAIACTCYVLFAVYLLKGQQENIRKIWNDRWPEGRKPDGKEPGRRISDSQ